MTDHLGAQLAAAQLAATVAFADAAPGASAVLVYTTVYPGAGAAEGVPAQFTVALAKPCGTIAAGALTLNVADPLGTMVLSNGVPKWARWQRSDGVVLYDGAVSNVAGAAFFTIEGGTTPPGESAPLLLAGGLVRLGPVVMT